MSMNTKWSFFPFIIAIGLICGCRIPFLSPPGGAITGKVLDANGNPLLNTNQNDTLIVSLFCLDESQSSECLHQEDLEDIEVEDLIEHICEPGEKAENCMLHLGQGATTIGADGSYSLSQIPPGQYGLVFIFSSEELQTRTNYNTQNHGPKLILVNGFSIRRDIDIVESNQTTEYDIQTDLVKKE